MGFCSLHRSRVKRNVCDYQLNKVKEIYLISVNDLDKFTINGSGIDGCGSELVTATTKSNERLWALIEPSDNTASYTDTLMVNDNGTKYKQHQLNFSIGGQYDANAVCDVDALALGEYVAVVKLSSGNQVCLGDITTPLTASSIVTTQPSSPTEFNGIQIEMTADALHSVIPVSSSVMYYISNHLQSTKEEIYKVIANGEDGQVTYYAPNGVVEKNAFGQSSKINNIDVGGVGVTELANQALYGLSNLSYVYLGENIRKIGADALGANVSLSKVYFRGTKEILENNVTVDANAFRGSKIHCIECIEDSEEVCY